MSAVSAAAPAAATGIITPEAVVLDVDTAGFGPRISAGIIDLVLSAIIVGVLSVVAVVVAGGDESTTVTIISIVVFAVLFGYPILFETLWRGRTPGKAALGLRAVGADGAPLRLKDATLRAMGGIVDKVLPPGGVTGALFVTFTPRHQRVGDLIAGTIVIRDPDRSTSTPALWFSAPPGLEQFAATIDPTPITVEHYTVVRSFLLRARGFDPAVRIALARDVATRLARVVHHAGSPHVAPETFLVCAMAQYQRRNGPGVARTLVPPTAPVPVPAVGAHGPSPARSGW